MQPKPQARPATLLAQATQDADETHRRRIAELKTLAPLLAHLDKLVPALAERGLNVHQGLIRGLYRWREPGNSEWHRRTRNVLDLRTNGFWISDREQASTQWWQALIGLGFEVAERPTTSAFGGNAILRRGPLLLRVDAPLVEHAEPEPAPAAPAVVVESLEAA